MTIIHTLPEIDVKNSGGHKKRRSQKIPTLWFTGRKKYSDVLVGGVLWLIEHGMSQRDVARRLNIGYLVVHDWKVGKSRPHVVPREPDEIFMAELRDLHVVE